MYGTKAPSNKKDTDYSQYCESLMFCGIGSGDLDKDGSTEAVVAGSRLDDGKPTYTGNNLDHSYYDVAYFTYDASEKTYSLKGVPQWFSTDGDDYAGDIKMDSGRSDNDNTSDVIEAPLTVLGFAEQGANYADSVFVNGFVLRMSDSNHTYDPAQSSTPDDNKDHEKAL